DEPPARVDELDQAVGPDTGDVDLRDAAVGAEARRQDSGPGLRDRGGGEDGQRQQSRGHQAHGTNPTVQRHGAGAAPRRGDYRLTTGNGAAAPRRLPADYAPQLPGPQRDDRQLLSDLRQAGSQLGVADLDGQHRILEAGDRLGGLAGGLRRVGDQLAD